MAQKDSNSLNAICITTPSEPVNTAFIIHDDWVSNVNEAYFSGICYVSSTLSVVYSPGGIITVLLLVSRANIDHISMPRLCLLEQKH